MHAHIDVWVEFPDAGDLALVAVRNDVRATVAIVGLYRRTAVLWYGRRPKGTQHVQAISKEDKIKLEPSVATGCVDGSTPMVWYGRVLAPGATL